MPKISKAMQAQQDKLIKIKDLINNNKNMQPTVRAWIRLRPSMKTVGADVVSHHIKGFAEGHCAGLFIPQLDDLIKTLEARVVRDLKKKAKSLPAFDASAEVPIPGPKAKKTAAAKLVPNRTRSQTLVKATPQQPYAIPAKKPTKASPLVQAAKEAEQLNKPIKIKTAIDKVITSAAKPAAKKIKAEAVDIKDAVKTTPSGKIVPIKPGSALDISGVRAMGEMHMPKNPSPNLHPVATDPANFTADVREITKAHPTLLYGAAVMRPSLALAQGHALSLLQGLDVDVHEFTVSTELEGFHVAFLDLVNNLKKAAKAAGLESSKEVGMDRSKGRLVPATLRFFARKGQVGTIVVMYSGSTIMVHEMGGFPEGVKLIEDFARAYTPREKGFIHHLAIVDGKIAATRYENNDDGQFPDEAYPFITDELGGANAYLERYLSSKSAIMNLYGRAGTGKSTLMRKAATRSTGRTCLLVDNPMFYQDPAAASALVQYIRQISADGGRPMLMLEEADEFLKQKDNAFLPQLLSLTSGVLTVDVKIMIATNLTKIDDLMAAMLRAGRTFGSAEFFAMTPEQGVACHKAFNLAGEPPVFKDKVTLSEILCEKAVNIGTNKNRLGFVG